MTHEYPLPEIFQRSINSTCYDPMLDLVSERRVSAAIERRLMEPLEASFCQWCRSFYVEDYFHAGTCSNCGGPKGG